MSPALCMLILWSCFEPLHPSSSRADFPVANKEDGPSHAPSTAVGGAREGTIGPLQERRGPQTPVAEAAYGYRGSPWRTMICQARFAAIARVVGQRSKDNTDGHDPRQPSIYTEIDLEVLGQAVEGAAGPGDVVTFTWIGGSLDDGRTLSRRGHAQGPIPSLGSTIIVVADLTAGDRQQILGAKVVTVDEKTQSYSYRGLAGSSSDWVAAFGTLCGDGSAK